MTATDARRRAARPALAALALVLNAFVWGTSWWPLRHLHAAGLHPLWATAVIFSAATAVIVALRPRAVGQVLAAPALWLLLAAAGATNAAFNWAVVVGDVVRVVLLFYLMPLWAVLLARLVLGERLTGSALLRMALALAGAAIVLWPTAAAGASAAHAWGDALPVPRSLADWLAVAGGFAFACNNVLLRREAGRPEAGRALAMFAGAAIVALLLAATLTAWGPLPAPAAASWSATTLALVGALTIAFLAGNMALQFGAAQLPANRTAVIMLTEVVFASASAVALGAGTLTGRLLFGGGLIVASAVLAALIPGRKRRVAESLSR